METLLQLAATAALTVVACLFKQATDQRTLITELKEFISMTAQDTVNEITAQIKKGTSEVVAKISELEAANPEVDFSELKAAAQALDDVIPDAPEPVVEPTPEPEPETPVDEGDSEDVSEG